MSFQMVPLHVIKVTKPANSFVPAILESVDDVAPIGEYMAAYHV